MCQREEGGKDEAAREKAEKAPGWARMKQGTGLRGGGLERHQGGPSKESAPCPMGDKELSGRVIF